MAGPNLGNYFGRGPMHGTFKLRVFTPRTTEPFDAYGYRLDEGYLIIYSATQADNDSVRLNPLAVFAPGGWYGYATEDDDDSPKLVPIGFQPQIPPPTT